jgi:hypothetical protein
MKLESVNFTIFKPLASSISRIHRLACVWRKTMLNNVQDVFTWWATGKKLHFICVSSKKSKNESLWE